MAAVLRQWREAATLILIAPRDPSSSGAAKSNPNFLEEKIGNESDESRFSCSRGVGREEDYELLLLKRSKASKFMPNMNVFPGGVAEDSDFSEEWRSLFGMIGSNYQSDLFHKLSVGNNNASPMFNRKRDLDFSIPAEVAFRICAIREAFEESGVLVALSIEKVRTRLDAILMSHPSSNNDLLIENSPQISQWRDRVNRDGSEFLKMCKELQVLPAIWSLYEWSNWLTPTTSKVNARRFDTAFFICCVDDKPHTEEDAGEIVDKKWASPQALLTEYFKEQSGLAAPQLYEISKLLHFPTASALFKHISKPERQRIERLFPVVNECRDATMEIMQGDELYPETADLFEPTNFRKFELSSQELLEKYPKAYRIINSRPHVLHCTVPSSCNGEVSPHSALFNDVLKKSLL